MLKAADGDPVISVGDCFVVRVGCEALNDVPMGRYDVAVTIITLIPGREIVRTILGRIRPPIGHIYGYRLQPGGAVGARVTSYCDWSEVDPRRREAGIFPVLSEGAPRATLGILARAVTRGCITTPPQTPLVCALLVRGGQVGPSSVRVLSVATAPAARRRASG